MIGKKIIFIISILILIAPIILASPQLFEQLKIPENHLIGCQTGCSYNPTTHTLILNEGAGIVSYPRGLTVQLNGGKMALKSGVVAKGKGIVKVPDEIEPFLIKGGTLILLNLSNTYNLTFTNTEIPLQGKLIKGNGNILDGKLNLEDVILEGIGENTRVKQATYQGYTEEGYLFKSYGNSYIGDANGGIILNPGNEFALTLSDHESAKGFTQLTVKNPVSWDKPQYQITGKPNLYLKNIERGPVLLNIKGENHFFSGDLLFKEGETFFPKDPEGLKELIKQNKYLKGAPYMMDGVYVRPKSTDVGVCFKEKSCSPNSISLTEKLKIKGNGFSVALSQPGTLSADPNEIRGGFLSESFDHEFTMPSKYLPQTRPEGSSSNTRVIAEMFGGEVTVDPVVKKINVEGVTYITNGINEFYYDSEDVDFKLTGCRDGQYSCGTLDYQMNDGGQLDILKTVNKIPIETGKENVDFDFGFDAAGGKVKKTFELNREKVYALGYRGGSAAVQLVGENLAHQEWGHAGVMFFKESTWWVAEADGVSTKVEPFEESLFNSESGKLHGLWEIKDSDPQKTLIGIEKIAGAKYDVLPWTRDAIHCSEVVCETFKFATGKELKGGATIDHLDGIEKTPGIYAQKANFIKSPNWVFGGGIKGEAPEYLEEVFVDDFLSLKDYCKLNKDLRYDKKTTYREFCQRNLPIADFNSIFGS